MQDGEFADAPLPARGRTRDMSILQRIIPGVAVAVATAGAGAQSTPRSQLGVLTQSVGGARIEIMYRRPVARGRELFGALVPWGKIWTPSADSAARVTLSEAVEINGSKLAA